ncbi:MAG: hypothetical protein Kow0059_09470 [Candidatus Sumerlaeia bacterium]
MSLRPIQTPIRSVVPERAASPPTDAGNPLRRWGLLAAAVLAIAAVVLMTRFNATIPRYAATALAAVWLIVLGPITTFVWYWGTTYLILNPFPIPVSVNQIFGAMFFLSWVWWVAVGLTARPRTRWLGILTLFFAFNTLSALLGESRQYGFVMARQTATYYLFMVALAGVLTTRRRLNVVLWVVVVFAAVSALIGLAEYATQLDFLQQHRNLNKVWLAPRPFAGLPRINGTLPNSIVFATFGLFALPFCYFLTIWSRNAGLRPVVVVLTLLIAVTSLLTFNRQTIVELGVLFLLLVFLFRSRYRFFFALIFGAALLLIGPIVLGTTLARVQQGRTGWDLSVIERRDKILIALEILRHKPLFGVGLGSFPEAWDDYINPGELKFLWLDRTNPQYPDMGYMQLLAETGVVGFICQLALLVGIGVRLWRERRRALAEGQDYKAGLCSLLLSLMGLIVVVNGFQDFWISPRLSLFYALFLIVATRPRPGESIWQCPAPGTRGSVGAPSISPS